MAGNGKTSQDRLAGLPREQGLVLEGTIRQLSTKIREGDRVVQPAVVLWVDATKGTVRNHTLLSAPIFSEAAIATVIESLVAALASPSVTSGGTPALAGHISVDSPELAAALQPLLEPLGVELQFVNSLPMVEDAFISLDSYLEENREPFVWELDHSLLFPLYQAAAKLARRAPWTYLADYPPFAVALGNEGPQGNVKTLYGCVLGGQQTMFGIAFYFSRAGLQRTLDAAEEPMEPFPEGVVPQAMQDELMETLRRQGAPIDAIPPEILKAAVEELVTGAGDLLEPVPPMENTLVLYFDPAEEIDEIYLAWIEELGLPLASQEYVPTFVRTYQDGETRLPNVREVRGMTHALDAIDGFIESHQHTLQRVSSSPFLPDKGWLTTMVQVVGNREIEVVWPGD